MNIMLKLYKGYDMKEIKLDFRLPFSFYQIMIVWYEINIAKGITDFPAIFTLTVFWCYIIFYILPWGWVKNYG